MTWAKLEAITPNGISHHRKDKRCRIPLTGGAEGMSNSCRQKVQQRLLGAVGRKAIGLLFNGHRISVLQNTESPVDGYWVGHTQCEWTSGHWPVYSSMVKMVNFYFKYFTTIKLIN